MYVVGLYGSRRLRNSGILLVIGHSRGIELHLITLPFSVFGYTKKFAKHIVTLVVKQIENLTTI
ncbi:MAG: hypothetical protein KGH62_02650 [Candidatus Micrarchaeota archaeon]|nr:hypothetical protein [Candidatus Micrarchaeota archaeon]